MVEREELLFEKWEEVLSRRYSWLPNCILRESKENIVLAYKEFSESGCADKNFQDSICSGDPETSAQRLGEVLLYERLVHAGLKPESGLEGPDFKVEINGRVVWLELVTPTTGDDARIAEIWKSYDPLPLVPIALMSYQEDVC